MIRAKSLKKVLEAISRGMYFSESDNAYFISGKTNTIHKSILRNGEFLANTTVVNIIAQLIGIVLFRTDTPDLFKVDNDLCHAMLPHLDKGLVSLEELKQSIIDDTREEAPSVLDGKQPMELGPQNIVPDPEKKSGGINAPKKENYQDQETMPQEKPEEAHKEGQEKNSGKGDSLGQGNMADKDFQKEMSNGKSLANTSNSDKKFTPESLLNLFRMIAEKIKMPDISDEEKATLLETATNLIETAEILRLEIKVEIYRLVEEITSLFSMDDLVEEAFMTFMQVVKDPIAKSPRSEKKSSPWGIL